MSTVVGNPVIFELPIMENGVALTGKAAVLNALTNNGFTYCRHKTPAGTYSSITVGDWAEDGTTGVYRCALTASGVEGKYSGLVAYVESGHTTQTFFGEEEVIADPAALAAAVAAVQTTVDGIDTLVDVAVSTRATVAALSSLGLLISSPGAQVASAGSLSIRRGDTTTWTITLDIDLTGATIWFAAKPAIMASPTADLDDATAIIDAYWIHGGASAVTDINGASVGTITVTDVAAGTVVIVLTSAFTTTLSAMSISWEVQIKTSSGAIVTWTNGTLTISNDLIRRVTTP